MRCVFDYGPHGRSIVCHIALPLCHFSHGSFCAKQIGFTRIPVWPGKNIRRRMTRFLIFRQISIRLPCSNGTVVAQPLLSTCQIENRFWAMFRFRRWFSLPISRSGLKKASVYECPVFVQSLLQSDDLCSVACSRARRSGWSSWCRLLGADQTQVWRLWV